MNRTKVSCTLFCLSILLSCNSTVSIQNETVPVIDLASEIGKGRVVNLSEVASDIRYVQLETSDSSLIGMYPRVFYENERIYVLSVRVVKVFDKNGKFLFKFDRRGRGAQEYQSGSIRVMSNTGDFMVQTNAPFESVNLIFYDREGRYIKRATIPYQKYTFQDRTIEINNNLFVTSASPKYKDSVKLCAIVYDSLFNIQKEIPMPYISENAMESGGERIFISSDSGPKPPSNIMFSINSPQLYRYDESVRLVTSENDTIFSIDSKMNYSPAFSINYGKFKNEPPKKDVVTVLEGDFISLRPGYYIESRNSLILNFYLRNFAHEPYERTVVNRQGTRVQKYADCYALFDKKSGELTLLNQPVKSKLGFREDIMDGPVFLPTHISGDFYATALFSAAEIIEHAETNNVKGELKNMISNLKDSDNPVVAIVKLK